MLSSADVFLCWVLLQVPFELDPREQADVLRYQVRAGGQGESGRLLSTGEQR